jgi:hypothetical protein
MTDKLTFKLHGARELKKFMTQHLPESMHRRNVGAGMRSAAMPMKAAAEANAPKRSTGLQASIQLRTVRKRDDNFVAMTMGPMTNYPQVHALLYGEYGNRTPGRLPEPWYGKLHEVGYTTRDGRKIPGKYWMQRAFDAHELGYRNNVVREIRKKVLAAAKRHNAKSKATTKGK